MGFKPYNGEVIKDEPAKVPQGFKPYKGPTMIQNSNREDWATLPEPHDNMFAGMSDEDAKVYHDAYTRHPDTKTVYDPETREPILVYKGKPVPPPEGNNSILDTVLSGVETGLNPLKTVANAAAEYSDYIPDAMSDRGFTKGIAGGTYNAARDAVKTGVALEEKLGPISFKGQTRAFEDATPKYNPEGFTEGLGEVTGHTGTGIILGNKATAALEAAGVGRSVASKVGKFLPGFLGKIAKYAAVKPTIQGTGIAATTDTNSPTLFVGDNSVAKHLVGSPLVAGLETASQDEAQNVINNRLNVLMDTWFTVMPIDAAISMGSGALTKSGLYKLVIQPAKVLLSDEEKIRHVANAELGPLARIREANTPEEVAAVKADLERTLSNPDNQYVKYVMGEEGVDDVNIKLDPTTIMQQVAKESGSEADARTAEHFVRQRNKLIQEGGDLTTIASEAPEKGLQKLLGQSREAFGQGNSVEKGGRIIQDSTIKEADNLKTLGGKESSKAIDIADDISEKVYGADVLRTNQMNERYAKIPPDAMADRESFDSLYAEAEDVLPKKIKKLVDAWDGSFQYLNNVIKPKLSQTITAAFKKGDDITDLQALRDNIDNHQLDYIISKRSTTGQFKKSEQEAADAAAEAKRYAKDEVYPYRQGPLEDIRTVKKYNMATRPDEAITKSNQSVRSVIEGDEGQRKYLQRMRESLQTDEGGRSGSLIEDYRTTAEKAKSLKDQSEKLLSKSKFFKDKEPKDNLDSAFAKVYTDEEGLKEVKQLRQLSKNDPTVDKALKSSYSKKLDEALFPGIQTNSGTGQEAITSANANKEHLIKIGREIFKDKPVFMNAIEDLADVSNNIKKSRAVKAAPAGAPETIQKELLSAGKAAINAQAGPLSRIGTKENIIWRAIVNISGTAGALKYIKDQAFADPDKFVKMLESLNQKEKLNGMRTAFKMLVSAGVYGDGDEQKFEDDFFKLNPGEAGKKAMYKIKDQIPKGMIRKSIDKAEELGVKGFQLGTDAVKQTKKLFYGDESKNPKTSAEPTGKFPGLVEKGNIDLTKRTKVDMGDGTYGTVFSESREEDGKEVLYPRIVNGKLLSSEEAWKHYKKTGEHLGKFDNPEDADAYAEKLHEAQEEYYK